MAAVRAPSEADWSSIKPVFLDLYLERGKRLKDVMQILEHDYGFFASKKSFKTHITRWQAFKNYKAAEKEILIQQREEVANSPATLARLQLRQAPVKWGRVDRHAAELAKSERIALTGPIQSTAARKSRAASRSRVQDLSGCKELGPSAMHDPSETLLGAVRDLYTFQIKTQLVLPNGDSAKLDFSVYNDLYHAFGLMKHSSTIDRAFLILREIGKDMPTALAARPATVLHAILRLPNFLGESVDRVVAEILRMVCRLAASLPEHNLLRATLSRLNDMTTLCEKLPKIGQVHLDTVWSSRRMLLDTSRVDVLIDAIYSSKRHLTPEAVQSYAIDLMQVKTIEVFSFCQLTILLTSSYLEQEKYQQALDAATDALQKLQDVELDTPDMVSRSGYFTVQLRERAAKCHNHLGDIHAAALAYQQTYEAASHFFGAEDDRTRLALVEWDLFLTAHALQASTADEVGTDSGVSSRKSGVLGEEIFRRITQ